MVPESARAGGEENEEAGEMTMADDHNNTTPITRDQLAAALSIHRGEIVEADEWRPLADHVLELVRAGVIGAGGTQAEAPPLEPATKEFERFWRVKKHPGWHAVESFYDERGRLHTKLLSTELRTTEADARADGEATGLPERNLDALPCSHCGRLACACTSLLP
jgi:hypothetical protein